MDDMLPNALAIGVPYELFFHLTPKKLKAFYKAFKIKVENRDAEMWRNGQYTLSATLTAIDHCLSGKKAKTEYVKEPILQKAFEEDELTQEERDRREIERMILAEELWIKNFKKKGLPETVIK